MADVYKQPVDLAQMNTSRQFSRPSVARHPIVHESSLLIVQVSKAALTRPAAAISRLLLGSPGARIGGYRRTGYPELDQWMSGRDREVHR